MASFQGKRVSRMWAVVLRAAVRDKVAFMLTSGQRTMAEQTRLFFRNMMRVGLKWVPRPGRPLTAKPFPTAPHIRAGLQAHALDVNSLDGGETRLERWIDEEGGDWKNTVQGESWHGEVTEASLRRLYRYFKPLMVLRDDEWRWVRELDKLRRERADVGRRGVLKRVLAERRRHIIREARQDGGTAAAWRAHNRAARRRVIEGRLK